MENDFHLLFAFEYLIYHLNTLSIFYLSLSLSLSLPFDNINYISGKDINERETLALNYERALLDLAELKHENEKLRKLLNGTNISGKKKLNMRKQNIYTEVNNGFEMKKEWVDGEKSEKSLLFPSSNGFSMKHEVSILLIFIYPIYIVSQKLKLNF